MMETLPEGSDQGFVLACGGQSLKDQIQIHDLYLGGIKAVKFAHGVLGLARKDHFRGLSGCFRNSIDQKSILL